MSSGLANAIGTSNGVNGQHEGHGLKILIVGAGIGVSPIIFPEFDLKITNILGVNRSHCTQTTRP
jgi:hypothetical protein